MLIIYKIAAWNLVCLWIFVCQHESAFSKCDVGKALCPGCWNCIMSRFVTFDCVWMKFNSVKSCLCVVTVLSWVKLVCPHCVHHICWQHPEVCSEVVCPCLKHNKMSDSVLTKTVANCVFCDQSFVHFPLFAWINMICDYWPYISCFFSPMIWYNNFQFLYF